MDNFIKVDEENTNILHRRFVQRYREEKGRLLTDHGREGNRISADKIGKAVILIQAWRNVWC